MQQYYHCKLVCIFLNGLFLLLYNLFFLLSQYLVYDSDNLLLYISFEHRIILYGKVQLFIYYSIDRTYRCVGHDLSPKMTRSTCVHHKPYSNVLYVSSLPYLLSFQGLCNCISMQDASSSKSSIRLGNLFSIITESRQSLA